MFMTLPKVFNDMTLGGVIGTVFFILVLFAALTSSISLMETTVSILRDKFGWGRRTATLTVTIFILALGSFVSLGYGVLDSLRPLGLQLLDFFDFVSNSIMMPIVALLTCIFIGYIVKPKVIEDEVSINGEFKAKKFYEVLIKYVAPIFLIAILIFSILENLGMISV